MTLDLVSVTLMMAVVVISAGSLFVMETVLRRDTGAGRIWSLAFLGAMLTTVLYVVWALSPAEWVAVAIGNGAFVGGTGCLWLGARAFNGRRRGAAAITIGIGAVASLGAALIEGPDGGDWAGAFVMFVFLAVFAGLGAFESRRGPLGRSPSSVAFSGALAVVSVFYIARTVTFAVYGADGVAQSPWLGSIALGVLTTILIVASLGSLSSLRSDARKSGAGQGTALMMAPDGFFDVDSYATVLDGFLHRARFHGERIALISLRLDDLAQIGTAFGAVEARDIERVWREGVRRYSPPDAWIGVLCSTSLAVAYRPTSVGDARRVASRIHRRLLDDFAEMGSIVVPVVGVGVALTDGVGYESDALVSQAEEASRRSASSPDASVIIADID